MQLVLSQYLPNDIIEGLDGIWLLDEGIRLLIGELRGYILLSIATAYDYFDFWVNVLQFFKCSYTIHAGHCEVQDDEPDNVGMFIE